MDDVRARRLFALVGGVMTGTGVGLGAQALVSSDVSSPVLAFLLAGLGLGVMVSASLRE